MRLSKFLNKKKNSKLWYTITGVDCERVNDGEREREMQRYRVNEAKPKIPKRMVLDNYFNAD